VPPRDLADLPKLDVAGSNLVSRQAIGLSFSA
jgi:hypothetical protein